MTSRITHERFTLERRYDATPAQIFTAWKDVDGRTQWQKPADHLHLVYDADDFRVGGCDISRCWADGDASAYEAVVYYQDIVPDRRIVMSETVSLAGRNLSSALATVEIDPDGAGARMRLTLQIAAETGSDIFAGYREGWGALLENLVLHLTRETIP
ncbi:SRPBCC domain-containing protein [Maricaulis sp.]|uniref:SRPBCC domain-containing protein n=1 Tax=Maricaulis sp. TaxID=1486257 RepID=UPI0026109283|nr:SRPBCC domain-containing protein [Maricaulis sp.]